MITNISDFNIKAISLKQPWATLIANGFKTIETRKWYTKYRGLLAIHSSKNIDIESYDYFVKQGIITNDDYKITGKILCVCNLYDCKPMTKKDEQAAMCNIYDNAFSFYLNNIKKIKPIELGGKLNIFELPNDIKEKIIMYIK